MWTFEQVEPLAHIAARTFNQLMPELHRMRPGCEYDAFDIILALLQRAAVHAQASGRDVFSS
jgi:hypothetical protein